MNKVAVRIESEDNSKLKLVRKLKSKKHRDAEGKFVIEGINLLDEAVKKDIDLDFIILADDFAFDEDRLELSGENVYTVSRGIYENLCDAENGSGILAVAKKDCAKSIEDVNISDDTNVLVLDRVQDPGNIGTMIRTAVAAGYGAIAICKGTADIYSPKVLRATAGMLFGIPIVYAEDASDLMSMMKRIGKRVCVSVPRDGKPYYERDLSKGIALVIGNEGNGISDELIEMADERLTIPMKGGVESLNAAVSAAILMYEAARK